MTRGVDLEWRRSGTGSRSSRTLATAGLLVETVDITGRAEYDFAWRGDKHYIALHDIVLKDGETFIDSGRTPAPNDFRDRLTFVPPGIRITGWSSVADRANSFTAMIFNTAEVAAEVDDLAPGAPDLRPMVMFEDAALARTLGKMRMLLQRPEMADTLYVQSLALLAAVKLAMVLKGVASAERIRLGRLSLAQERLVADYLEQHLADDLSLQQLADLVRLSRFHFSRAFKRSFGAGLRQHVLRLRVERAKLMLRRGNLPVNAIAEALGFGSMARFSTVFRQFTGARPSEFRRSVL